MERKTGIFSIVVVLLIGILACSSVAQPPDRTPTQASHPNVIPTFVDAETLEASPNYLADCRLEYPQISQSQVGYEDIYSGITTEQDLQAMLGSPSKKIQVVESETEWLYNSNFVVFLEHDVVAEIFIFNDLLEPVQNYLMLYGCPDVVFVIDTNQHPSGDYDTLLLVYHSIGLTLMFDKFPIQITDTPVQASFFVPGSLSDFLVGKEFLEDLAKAKPVFWYEAIK